MESNGETKESDGIGKRERVRRGVGRLARTLLLGAKIFVGPVDDIAAIALTAINPSSNNLTPIALNIPPSYSSEASDSKAPSAGSNPPSAKDTTSRIIHDAQGKPLARIPG